MERALDAGLRVDEKVIDKELAADRDINDLCIDMCTDMLMDMCGGVCTDMCVDMCINMRQVCAAHSWIAVCPIGF